MAQLVFTSAKVVINSVDLSDHVRSVTLTINAKMLDDNTMGDTAESFAAGIQGWKADVEFVQDYASAKVDATMFPLIGAAAFPITINPVNAANSATNPQYTANAVLADYNPASGKFGDLQMAKVSLTTGGGVAMTRVTV